jgi:hypothetical protein
VTERSHSNTLDDRGTLAGWREWVSLPDVGVPWIKAKLDTGARTSSIHAYEVEPFTKDGAHWVRFRVRPWQESIADEVSVECPVHDLRRVRSSSGHVEERYVVKMRIELVGRAVTVEVTLSNRDQMGFRMLVGRQALRRGFVVDSGRSFVGGRAPRPVRRRNRGRPEA